MMKTSDIVPVSKIGTALKLLEQEYSALGPDAFKSELRRVCEDDSVLDRVRDCIEEFVAMRAELALLRLPWTPPAGAVGYELECNGKLIEKVRFDK